MTPTAGTTPEPMAECGNEIVEDGEECDGLDWQGATCESLGFAGGVLECSNECEFDTSGCSVCGDGVVEPGEECDDSNRVNFDGCDNDCTISSGAMDIVAGDEHVCALFHTGQIKCWGNFNSGRLGYFQQQEDVGDTETPAELDFVNVGAPVQRLALGSDFTCALLVTDDVVCWGNGQNGRLGQGSQSDLGSQEEPADIPAIDLGGTPTQIAAGAEHACAVLDTGEVRCWGRNNEGQLGLPGVDQVGDDELPAEMPVVDVGSNVEMIAAGRDHTCALLSTGGVLCWGRDSDGQLGTAESIQNIGDDEHPSSSTEVLLAEQAVMIGARYDHNCVVYVGGDVQCWGGGGSGRLGYGNANDVGDDENVARLAPLTLVGGEPSHLATGAGHTCAHMTDTSIVCWGEGDNGRLGYNSTNDLFEPPGMLVDLNLPSGARTVSAGSQFTCSATESGDVKCWGANNRGQLGYGDLWTTDLGDNEPIDSVGPVMLE